MTTTINASTSSGLVQTADTSGVLALQTGNTTAVTIDASQNVVIKGTTASNAAAGLTIGNTSATPAGLNLISSTSGQGGVYFGDAVTGIAAYDGYIEYYQTAQAMAFGTASAEKMRITSAGLVGIGTNSPTQLLQLESAGNPCILLKDTTNNVQAYMFAGDVASYVGSANNYPVVFQINDTENMRLNTAGNLVLKGGTAAASGVGVTFPATQSASTDANCLDDYEEGEWTPTAYGSSSAGTTTYNDRKGFYTKIGRQITVSLYIDIASLTGTGALFFGGLPYQVKNISNINITGSVMTLGLNWTGGTSIVLYCNQASTYLSMYGSGDDIGWAQQLCVNEAFAIIGTVTYITD